MAGIADISSLEGDWEAANPVIILDSVLARRAIEMGELHNLILDAISALELSGKNVVVVQEAS